MVNYQSSKIYKIVNSENAIVYIGSTAQLYLSARLAQHRINSKRSTSPFHTAMREVGPEKFWILLIKSFPCNSKADMEAEEYRILDEHIAAGTKVYNDRVQGQTSTAARAKVIGENNPRFSSGCISLFSTQERGAQAWRFYFRVDKTTKTQCFAISKYGFWGAKWKAEAARKAMYPDWQNDEELELDTLRAIEI